MAAAASDTPPGSPIRSERNANSPSSRAYYEKSSPESKFNQNAFFNGNAPGVIEDEPKDTTMSPDSDTSLIDEGACPDESFRVDVERAVKFQRSQDGGKWHCSNVNSATRNADGGCALGLVLCSGDLCTMKKFTVAADGAVTTEASGGGLFGGF